MNSFVSTVMCQRFFVVHVSGSKVLDHVSRVTFHFSSSEFECSRIFPGVSGSVLLVFRPSFHG